MCSLRCFGWGRHANIMSVLAAAQRRKHVCQGLASVSPRAPMRGQSCCASARAMVRVSGSSARSCRVPDRHPLNSCQGGVWVIVLRFGSSCFILVHLLASAISFTCSAARCNEHPCDGGSVSLSSKPSRIAIGGGLWFGSLLKSLVGLSGGQPSEICAHSSAPLVCMDPAMALRSAVVGCLFVCLWYPPLRKRGVREVPCMGVC